MISEKKDKLVVVTSTYYTEENSVRFKLALKALGNLCGQGYLVVVVDNSSPVIRQQLQSLGVVVESQAVEKCTLGEVRRQALKLALKTAGPDLKAVLWIEPEKDFAPYVKTVTQPVISGEAQVVVPSRTEDGWSSYPVSQQSTEKSQNLASKVFTNEAFDVSFGPVVYSPDAVRKYLLQQPLRVEIPDTYVLQFMPTYIATLEPGTVRSVPVAFRYPKEQHDAEDADPKMLAKRLTQLKQGLEAHQKFGEAALIARNHH